MLASLVFADAGQELDCLSSYFDILVEETQSNVKETGMGLRCDTQEQTDLIVRVDVFRQCEIDVTTLRWRETLQAKTVVHVSYVETFERADGIQLCKILLAISFLAVSNKRIQSTCSHT